MSLSALQNTITPVIGFSAFLHTLCAQSPLHGEHSGQALLDAQNSLTNNDGRILPGTHLTPGWRVASAG